MKKQRIGFTFIELLVTVAIVSILVGIVASIAVEQRRKQSSLKSIPTSIVQRVGAKPQTNPDSVAVAAEQGLKNHSPKNVTASTPKFLYVISGRSGQVLVYSSVRGRVETFGEGTRTPRYLKWRDTDGGPHELYVPADHIVIHISSVPLATGEERPHEGATLKLETDK